MKARNEIMGRCIVNIQTASEIGRIKDVLIDPAARGIAFYVLAEPSDYFGARLIDQKNAVGIGDFALTVAGEDVIEDVAHCPQAMGLLRGAVGVVGTFALTDKGILLGRVREIFFDETTGGIVKYRIKDDGGKVFDIVGEDVITLGSNFTILLDDSELFDLSEDELDEMNGDDAVGEESVSGEAYEQRAVSSHEEERRSGFAHPALGSGAVLSDSERFLGVSARPMSAAELALAKAAETLRKKYTTDAVQLTAEAIAEGADPDFRQPDFANMPCYTSKSRAVTGSQVYRAESPVGADRVDRGDRAGRTERAGWNEGRKNADRPGRPEQTDKLDRGDEREERYKAERRGRADERERTEKTEGANKEERVDNVHGEIHRDRADSEDRRDRLDREGRSDSQHREDRRDRIERDKHERDERTEGTGRAASEHEGRDKDAEKTAGEDRAVSAGKAADREAAKGNGKAAVGSGVVMFPESGKQTERHGKTSLAAAEIIYPKHFNLFDRRQMQYLLGKRLFQAVQLESGEIMEEGEYITAEMLSRVRTRNTLMELTAHVRKA